MNGLLIVFTIGAGLVVTLCHVLCIVNAGIFFSFFSFFNVRFHYSLDFGSLACLLKVASHFLVVDIGFLVLDSAFSWVCCLICIPSESAVALLDGNRAYYRSPSFSSRHKSVLSLFISVFAG